MTRKHRSSVLMTHNNPHQICSHSHRIGFVDLIARKTRRAMAPSRRRRRLLAASCTLPYDLVLDIVARSDAATVVRSAATCKPLRRDILNPDFIRRICCRQHGAAAAVVPPLLVGYLSLSVASPRFSLVHPAATLAAASFVEDHLAPFLSRRAAADLDRRDVPLASRNGLVVLRRHEMSSGIYVYDPMTGVRADLPHPPDIGRYRGRYGLQYALLTAADGIGSGRSFLLLATNSEVSRVQTATAAAGGGAAWGPVISVGEPEPEGRPRGVLRRSTFFGVQPHSCAVVLNGSIHWLMCSGSWDMDFYIITYDVPRRGQD